METKCKVHSLLCDDDQVYYADTKRSVGTGGDGEVTGAGMGGDKSKCLWERVGMDLKCLEMGGDWTEIPFPCRLLVKDQGHSRPKINFEASFLTRRPTWVIVLDPLGSSKFSIFCTSAVYIVALCLTNTFHRLCMYPEIVVSLLILS